MNTQEALEVLGIPSFDLKKARPRDLPEVKEAYKNKAGEVHPDRGGTPEDFHRVKQAFDLIKEALHVPSKLKCEACEGKGHIEIRNGFHVIKQRCRWCRGTGREVL